MAHADYALRMALTKSVDGMTLTKCVAWMAFSKFAVWMASSKYVLWIARSEFCVGSIFGVHVCCVYVDGTYRICFKGW